MGWTFEPKPSNVKEYLKKQLTWHNPGEPKHACLDLAMTLTTAYAAVETLHEDGRREVRAAVILLKYTKDSYYNFGTKDMSEGMGPCEDHCPERILRLLTPTESEYAQEWRARCWANLEAKKAARAMKKEGTVLVPKNGTEMEIADYGKFRRFKVGSFTRTGGRRGFYLSTERVDGRAGPLFKPSAWLLNQLKAEEVRL